MVTSLPPAQMGAAQTSAVTLGLLTLMTFAALIVGCATPLCIRWLMQVLEALAAQSCSTPELVVDGPADASVAPPPPLIADRALIETLPVLPAMPSASPSAFPLYTPPALPPARPPASIHSGQPVALRSQHDGHDQGPQGPWPPEPRVKGAKVYRYIVVAGQPLRVDSLRLFTAYPAAKYTQN